jgi:AraC family transcriptional regulator of arabinose operon
VRSLRLPAGQVRDNFRAALERTLQFQNRRLPNADDFAFNALEEALLWAHLAASRSPWMRTDPRIRRAMDYLAADLRRPFRLDVLAQRCGLSVSRLAHLFKSEAGLTPQQFFEQQRMWQASQLLQRTGLGIGEIANELGYNDPFYFSNRFRRYAGESPSRFRRKKRTP